MDKTFKKSNLGNYSLFIAFIGFIIIKAINFHPVKYSTLDLITLIFEASLVGALADWYAVTALFRHPLGLKIPHSNILAKKKDEIAHGISSVMKDFLPHGVIKEHLESMDFVTLISKSLLQDGNNKELKEVIKKLLIELTIKLKNSNTREKSTELITTYVNKINFSDSTIKIASSFINSKNYYNSTLSLSTFLRDIVIKNKESLAHNIEEQIKGELPFLMQMFAKGKGELVVNKILIFLDTLKDENSSGYISIKKEIIEFLYNLETNENSKINFNEKIQNIIKDPTFLDNILVIIDKSLNKVLNNLQNPDGNIDKLIDSVINYIRDKYLTNFEKKTVINLWISDFIFNLVEKHDLIDKSALLIKDEITKLSEDEFVEFIEANVYNDLQYIRLNGAVVGGLGGAFIYFVQVLISFIK